MTTVQITLPPELIERLDAIEAQLRSLTTTAQPNELLTAEEAAQVMLCSVQTIRRYAREGKLPVASRVGAHMRFRRQDLTLGV